MRGRAAALVAALASCGGGERSGTDARDPRPRATAGGQRRQQPDLDRALTAQATALVDAFVNEEPVLTADRGRVVFVSDRDGLPQLYVADAAQPASAPRRLVERTERVGGPILTADGAGVVFMSDRGGDEMWTIHRVPLDGGPVVDLTPGEPLSRDPPFLPPGAPDRMFFTARSMEDPASSIYMAPVGAAGRVHRLYREKTPGFLSDVSPDGRAALLVRYTSHAEQTLVRVDLASGAARVLYPPRGQKAAIADASFSADGKRIYLGTDGGAEQGLVLSLAAASGKELARYVEREIPTASVRGIAVARRGGLVAVTLHAGNRNQIRLLDGRTMKARAPVELPLGEGSATRFSDDGALLTAQWSTPAAPTDIVAIDTATGAVRPLRSEARPSLDGLPGVEVSIAEVKGFDGTVIPVNVYRPAGARGRLPVIVRYHGGPAGWAAVGWSATVRFFLLRGYAWVEPNVRGSGGFGRAYQAADDGARRVSAFRDVETTARWVAAQPWADRRRMVALGESYGGYVVLTTLIRHPELWRAGVDMFGFVSLGSLMASTSGLVRQNYLTEFGDPDKDAALLASLSPLSELDRLRAPLFVYAGANDPRVPRAESDRVVKELRARRVPVEYMLAADEGHSLSRRETQIAFLVRVAGFLQSHAR
jgi:dipeptidyl aminopeptidase/acylaminoacyl peptidase